MAKATYSKVISANPIKNNGGTVVWGTQTNRVVTQTFGLHKLSGYRSPTGGVIPPLHEAALNFTGKVISAGPFGQMRTNKYMITKVTKEIATVANNSLFITSNNNWTRSINYKESSVENITRGMTINYFTGQYTTALGVERDNFGTDNAAHPTRLVPGDLVIFYGNVNGGATKPTIKAYRARTTS